jgi:hypothetical protein
MEDTFRLNARRWGAIALLLYAIGVLIIILGLLGAIGILLSGVRPSPTPTPIPPEAIRAIAGAILILVSFVLLIVFALYAGFKGRSVVSKVDLRGWDSLVRMLGILYFLAALFFAIGTFLIPGTFLFYGTVIMFLISSILIMVCAQLIRSPELSMPAGIILIIAGILSMIAVGNIMNLLGPFGTSLGPQLPLFITGTLSGIALIIVGVALILRQMILQWPISHIIAAVGGILYAADFAYSEFSVVSFFASLPLPPGTTPAETAYLMIYSTVIAGGSLGGIAGILGIIALIYAITFVIKTGFPALARIRAPSASVELPTRELRYCPKCGAPVKPEDFYCEKCGYKLG